MTRVFNMVGISLFFNTLSWFKEEQSVTGTSFRESWERVFNKKRPQRGDWSKISDGAENYLLNNPTPFKSCAELQSIDAIRKTIPWNLEEVFVLHLITTNSEESKQAGKILMNFLADEPWISKKSQIISIKGLQIKSSAQLLNIGLQELAAYLLKSINKKVLNIGEKHRPKCLINITSGFKSIIPMLTLFGQLNDIPLVYIFEKESELIVLPALPVSFDFSLMEAFHFFFNGVKNNRGIKSLDIKTFNASSQFFFQQKMVSTGLFYQIDGSMYHQTFMGEMVANHVKLNLPNTNSSFGKGVELQFLEYFLLEPVMIDSKECKWPIHNYYIKDREFDFGIFESRSQNNCLLAVEIKSYNQLFSEKFINKISLQMDALNSDSETKHFHLYIYAIQLTQISPLAEDILNKVLILANRKKIKFKVFLSKMTIDYKEHKLSQSYFERFYDKKFTRDKEKFSTEFKYKNPYFLIEEIL